jgi:hypothetical protein
MTAAELQEMGLPDNLIDKLLKHNAKWKQRPLSLEGAGPLAVFNFWNTESEGPADLEWEIDYEALMAKVVSEIGRGQHGLVFKSIWKGILLSLSLSVCVCVCMCGCGRMGVRVCVVYQTLSGSI